MRVPARLLTLLALLASGGPAGAQTPPLQTPAQVTVLELFTSQGCSSCPPADSLLRSYVDRPNTIALSLSVDYWDHLGWKDTLASPKHTARQKAYVKAMKAGGVFTPQMVINGATQVIGSNKNDIEKALRTANQTATGAPASLTLARDANRLVIDVGATEGDGVPRSATVWLVVVSPQVEIEIKRGENRGKSLKYHNVVREISPVGMWAGKPLRIELPATALLEPDARCAVLVQVDDGGPILRAAWVATN